MRKDEARRSSRPLPHPQGASVSFTGVTQGSPCKESINTPSYRKKGKKKKKKEKIRRMFTPSSLKWKMKMHRRETGREQGGTEKCI